MITSMPAATHAAWRLLGKLGWFIGMSILDSDHPQYIYIYIYIYIYMQLTRFIYIYIYNLISWDFMGLNGILRDFNRI